MCEYAIFFGMDEIPDIKETWEEPDEAPAEASGETADSAFTTIRETTVCSTAVARPRDLTRSS